MKRFPALLLGIWVAFPFALSAAEFDAAAAINQVGLDVYRQLATSRPGQNLMVSPYSIESALALAYAGADGKTRDEMSVALHLPLEEGTVRQTFATLRAALVTVSSESAKIATTRSQANRPDTYAVVNGKRVELQEEPEPVAAIEWHEANRLFAESSYAFRASFLTLMRDSYAAPLEPVDFLHNAEKARDAINGWVQEQTQGKIHDLVPPKGVTAETRLALVNALYLKAPWETPFEKTFTKPQPFHPSGGATRDVPTMQRGGYLGYEHEDGLTVVSLDYLGHELRCLILLPDEGRSLEAVATALKPADFARWTKLGADGHGTLIALHLPRFRIEGTTFPLGKILRQLGMKTAFDEPPGSADFNRMAPRQPNDYLKLSEVFHQTFIDLNEEGTEAAAATAVAMGYATGAYHPPLEVRIDRPFLFAIQHRASGTCLFLGRITDPR